MHVQTNIHTYFFISLFLQNKPNQPKKKKKLKKYTPSIINLCLTLSHTIPLLLPTFLLSFFLILKYNNSTSLTYFRKFGSQKSVEDD